MQHVESKDQTLTPASENASSNEPATSTSHPAKKTHISRSTATVDAGAPIETGTIKFFNLEKGYGFVTTERGDLFLHISAYHARGLTEAPNKGDPVRFQRGVGRDGRPLVAVIYP